MKTLSFVVLLALVSFCAAQNNEIGDNKALLGHPRNVEANWKKFMVRLLRELNLPQEPSSRSIDQKPEQDVSVEDVVKAGKTNRASQSCSSTTGCTATASETNTSSSGTSTGTSSSSTGTSSSTSTGTSSSSSSSSSGSSSSSSSSSG